MVDSLMFLHDHYIKQQLASAYLTDYILVCIYYLVLTTYNLLHFFIILKTNFLVSYNIILQFVIQKTEKYIM
jgi:hypothetical protein